VRSSTVICAIIALFTAPPLAAQEIVYESVEVYPEQSPGDGGERMLAFHDGAQDTVQYTLGDAVDTQGVTPAPIPAGIASYGPFRVLDNGRAALVDATDADSPAQFAAMLRDHPGIGMIEMVECPGTEDDLANLKLGRMIRAHGIATHVPRGGSVRSGAVELFLAGAHRYADEGAEFAVHSWLDDDGREAGDFAATAPVNQRYIAYYEQMGLTEPQAQNFYAMTNSVPFESALWFGTKEMAKWVALDREPVLASL